MYSAGRRGIVAAGLLVLPLTACSGGGASAPGSSRPGPQGQVIPSAALAQGHGSSPGSGPSASPGRPVSAPALDIVSPRPGDVVQAPVTVRYIVTGVDTGTGSLRLRLTIGDPPVYSLEWPVSGQEGTASIPDDKLVAGRRDLRFSLVGADGSAVARLAPVTVGGVTIVGRR